MKPQDIKWIQQVTQEIVRNTLAARAEGKPQFYQALTASNFPEQDTREQLQNAVSTELKNQGFTASQWAAMEPGIFSIIVPMSTEAKGKAEQAGYLFDALDGIAPPQ